MSGFTVRYRTRFGRDSGQVRTRFGQRTDEDRTRQAGLRCVPAPKTPPAGRAARMLALAHHINSLVDAGDLASYAAAAEALGLTRARMTQVMNLLLLAPEVQERIALGDLSISERGLRRVVREAAWQEQHSIIELPPAGAQRREWSALS